MLLPQGYPNKKRGYIASQGATPIVFRLYFSFCLHIGLGFFAIPLSHPNLQAVVALLIFSVFVHSLAKIYFYQHYLLRHLSLGPTELTVVRFWEMIWEYQIPTIVMLTRCVESAKVSWSVILHDTNELDL